MRFKSSECLKGLLFDDFVNETDESNSELTKLAGEKMA